jgi:hypothetical protein
MTTQTRYPIASAAFADLFAAAIDGRHITIECTVGGECYVVINGDIGDDQREVEYEPLTAPSVPEPIRTPAPTPAPVEPEKVPA